MKPIKKFNPFIILLTFALLLTTSMCFGATYYVDATNGIDNNNGLSPTAPWKTIAKVNALDFHPGDNILFKRGEIWREALVVPSSGSTGSPIVFGPYGTGADPKIDGLYNYSKFWTSEIVDSLTCYWTAEENDRGGKLVEDDNKSREVFAKADLEVNTHFYDEDNNRLYVRTADDDDPDNHTWRVVGKFECGVLIDNKSYVVIENFEIMGGWGQGVVVRNASTNITLQNLEVHIVTWTGIWIGLGYSVSSNIVIEGNTIYDVGYCGVQVKKATNVTVRNNTIHHSCYITSTRFGAGVKSFGSHDPQNRIVSDLTVEGNTIHHIGYWMDDVSSSELLSYTARGIHMDMLGSNIRIRRNHVYDGVDHGIIMEVLTESETYYNLVHDNSLSGIILSNGGGGSSYRNKIYNNVSYGNDVGIVLDGKASYVMEDNEIKNNIAVSNRTYQLKAQLGGENDGTLGSGNVYTHNCFDPDAVAFILWGVGNNLDAYDAWETAYGSSTNSAEANPLFMDAANNNFSLQSVSPCINAGTDVALAKDIVGNIIRGNPDIGAFEFMYISPPKNLRIKE